jgi:hypothetical protein
MKCSVLYSLDSYAICKWTSDLNKLYLHVE